MMGYIVQVTDEGTGALMAAWPATKEEYAELSALMAFKDRGEMHPQEKIFDDLRYCIEEASRIVQRFFGSTEDWRTGDNTTEEIDEDKRMKDIAFKAVLDFYIGLYCGKVNK